MGDWSDDHAASDDAWPQRSQALPTEPPLRRHWLTPRQSRRHPAAPPPSSTTFAAWVLATLPASNFAALVLIALLGQQLDAVLVPVIGFNSAQLGPWVVNLLSLAVALGAADADQRELAARGYQRATRRLTALLPPLYLFLRGRRAAAEHFTGYGPFFAHLGIGAGVLAASTALLPWIAAGAMLLQLQQHPSG